MTGRWRDQAACAGMDPAVFFPPDEGARGVCYAAAYAVCARCPVRSECLDEAIRWEGTVAHQYRAGVWGGASPARRTEIARARRARTTGAAA